MTGALTVKEYAKVMGVPAPTVKRQILSGVIPAVEDEYRGRKKYLIPLAELPEELQTRWAERESRPLRLPLRATEQLTTQQCEEAEQRIRAVSAMRVFIKEGYPRKTAAKKAGEQVGASYRSALRWYDAWNTGGEDGVAKIATARGRKKVDRSGLLLGKSTSDTFSPDAVKMFHTLYLTDRQPSVKACYRYVCQEAERQGWRVPSYDTVRRYVQALPRTVLIGKREGTKALEDKVLPYMVRDTLHKSLHSLDLVVGDHHQIDVAVLDGDKIVFPWVTAWMDVASRKLVGWCISTQPNGNTIAYALRKVITDYGVPSTIYMDNGRDYRSRQLNGTDRRIRVQMDSETEGIFQRLGVKTTFAKAYNAKAKLIERFFNTVGAQFSRFVPGYRGAGVKTRPESLKELVENKKLYTLAELTTHFGAFVENIYHQENHKTLKMSPNQYFTEHTLPRERISKEDLRLLMMKSMPRVVGRNGVKLFDSYYTSEALQEHLGQRVIFRYDPEDLSQVYAYSSEDGRMIDIVQRWVVDYGLQPTEQDYKAFEGQKKRIRKTLRELDEMRVPVNFDDMLFRSAVAEAEKASENPGDIKRLYPQHQLPQSREALEKAREKQKQVAATLDQLFREQIEKRNAAAEAEAEKAPADIRPLLPEMQKTAAVAGGEEEERPAWMDDPLYRFYLETKSENRVSK